MPQPASSRHAVFSRQARPALRRHLCALAIALAVSLGTADYARTAEQGAPLPSSGGERQSAATSPELTVRASEAALLPGSNELMEFLYGPAEYARVHYWWGGVPRPLAARGLRNGSRSNIRKSDYTGPETCKECHASNYEKWQTHAHRLMNARATPDTVKGDFSGKTVMDYLGGKARFYQENGTNYMRLERDGTNRVYAVFRTIGSRFFQYYVGKLVEGPEPAEHPARTVDHVLPLGYLLEYKEWMPVIHIDEEKPDGQRADAFAGPSDIPYDKSCSVCHTTWPVGDWLMSFTGMARAQYFSPFGFDFNVSDYLREMHPDITGDLTKSTIPRNGLIGASFGRINDKPVAEHGVALGVTCEACHNGGRAHAENSTKDRADVNPFFFPTSPYLYSHAPNRAAAWAKRPQNENWICARCHSGGRPSYAAGMAVWNSVEFADAQQGSCYLKDPLEKRTMPGLTCVHCHNPHQGIGRRWTKTPQEDDAKCLDCHKQFEDKTARLAHTHHPENSPGDNCMNCHMPKINEGLHDVVRTHTIFKPTDARMIEANQPNACNLCHLKENIDWTIGYLRQWYPKSAGPYAEARLNANYPNRNGPVGTGWLKSPHEHTRLIAVETLAKAGARWALPEMMQILDDPFLINRRFTTVRLGEMLGTDLREFGYHFYQMKAERQEPIQKILAEFLKAENNNPKAKEAR